MAYGDLGGCRFIGKAKGRMGLGMFGFGDVWIWYIWESGVHGGG